MWKRMAGSSLAAILGLSVPTAPAWAAENISPAQLAAAIESGERPRILDVRSEAEFAEGHVPGAQLIPHDQLADRLTELGNPGEVVVYCRSGRRVGLVRETLSEAGFAVRELEGSFQAWQAAELPVSETGQ